MVSAPEYSTVVSASQPCICKWRRHSRRYLREGDPRIERQIVRIVVVKGGNLRAGRQRKLRLPMFEVSAFAPGDQFLPPPSPGPASPAALHARSSPGQVTRRRRCKRTVSSFL